MERGVARSEQVTITLWFLDQAKIKSRFFFFLKPTCTSIYLNFIFTNPSVLLQARCLAGSARMLLEFEG